MYVRYYFRFVFFVPCVSRVVQNGISRAPNGHNEEEQVGNSGNCGVQVLWVHVGSLVLHQKVFFFFVLLGRQP
jgi:hypothetical protein